jgi:hypothetical protein
LPLDKRPKPNRCGHHHNAGTGKPVKAQTIGDQEQGPDQFTGRLMPLRRLFREQFFNEFDQLGVKIATQCQ